MQGPRFLSHRGGSEIEPTDAALAVVGHPVKAPPLDAAASYDDDKARVSSHAPDRPPRESRRGILDRIRSASARARTIVVRHGQFIGPGAIASIAYIDPGNFATDLQAGSQFGYSLLSIVLLASLMALVFQLLATRLGVVSGLDLASHCRALLYDRPRHKLLIRWGVLYPLYVLSELGIIFTDLAELLGSAIALNLLVPKIPLPACVALTSLDVLAILWLFDSYPQRTVTRTMRTFELLLAGLVMIVLGCFVGLVVRLSPVWSDAFRGFIPSAAVVDNGALYVGTGIIGATVMLHAAYLGSKLATVRRAHDHKDIKESSSTASSSQESLLASSRPSLACVKAHIGHATFDIAGSLLGFALLINSAILIVSAAVFYYSPLYEQNPGGILDLFAAYDLMQGYLGKGFAVVFAIALFASATAASLTVTLAGQIVSEGFIQWKTTPWKRRAITRAIGIVPSLIVSISIGREGINAVLVASQVALSMILPFVFAPLIILTTNQKIMSVPTVAEELEDDVPVPLLSSLAIDVESSPTPVLPSPSLSISARLTSIAKTLNPIRRRRGGLEGHTSFSNSTLVVYIAWIMLTLICLSNVAAIVALAQGV